MDSLTAPPRHGLDDRRLIAIFRNMLTQRAVDTRGFQLNRQGKIGIAMGSEGHEAVQAGAGMAFVRGHDILYPYYRNTGIIAGLRAPRRRPVPLAVRAPHRPRPRPPIINHVTAKALGIASISSIIATQCTHAAGAAYAIKAAARAGPRGLVHVRRGRDERRRMARGAQLRRRAPFAGRVLVREQSAGRSRRIRASRWRSATSQPVPPVTACRARSSTDSIRSRSTARSKPRANERFPAAARPSSKRSATASSRTRRTTTTARIAAATKSSASVTNDPVPRFERRLIEEGVLAAEAAAALRAEVGRWSTKRSPDEVEAEPLPRPRPLRQRVRRSRRPWLG